MARPVVKRDDIEEAAIRLLATKGLAATTIRDIAAAAGVAEGALYRHYSGKDDMAWRLYCREVAAFTIAFEGEAGTGTNRSAISAIQIVDTASIPEPSTILLTISGISALCLVTLSTLADFFAAGFLAAISVLLTTLNPWKSNPN